MSKELKTTNTELVEASIMPKGTYLVDAERKFSWGVQKMRVPLIGYTEGQTEHYWCNMKKGKIFNAATKEVLDHSKRMFVPFDWQFMWAIAYPPVKKDANGKVIKTEDGNLIFNKESYKAKGLFTLYGVWTDEKGEVPKQPTTLCSIDFKSYSASDLKAILDAKCRDFDNGVQITLPLLRIKITGTEDVGQTQKFTFEVQNSKNYDFEYMINEWKQDFIEEKMPMYNAESMASIAEHNTSLNSISYRASNAKTVLPPKEAFEDKMPLKINKVDASVENEFTLLIIDKTNEQKQISASKYVELEESTGFEESIFE